VSEPEDHSINACYGLVATGDYWPLLLCSCGFKATDDSWEGAGAVMDGHLRLVNP
jgi:hypothetical protein